MSILKNILGTINKGVVGAAQQATALFNKLPPIVTQLVTGPNAYDTHNTTPTVGQLAAAAFEVVTNPFSAPPSLQPFMSGGKQMQVVDVANGLLGVAWVTPAHEVIVSFSATNPVSPYGLPFYQGTVNSDLQIMKGQIAPAETEALAFVKSVQAAAAAQGINPQSGVFVTGVSLGGILAEYVASQTGIGGMGIVSAGLPVTSLTHSGAGANFVNVLAAGDPVSQLDQRYSADPQNFTAGLQHYGAVVHTGPAVNNTILQNMNATLLASAPRQSDIQNYLLNSFLGPAAVLAGDPSGLNYMNPLQLAYSSFAGTNHILGTVPTLLANANDSLAQFAATSHLA